MAKNPTTFWLGFPFHALAMTKPLPKFGSLPSATQKTLNKRKHSAKKLFAECFIFDTRQRALCRVSQIQHSAKSSLPSVFSPTLGKGNLKITF
jgi:hypothetical protein